VTLRRPLATSAAATPSLPPCASTIIQARMAPPQVPHLSDLLPHSFWGRQRSPGPFCTSPSVLAGAPHLYRRTAAGHVQRARPSTPPISSASGQTATNPFPARGRPAAESGPERPPKGASALSARFFPRTDRTGWGFVKFLELPKDQGRWVACKHDGATSPDHRT